ncbi:hypothetical protein [Halodesulfovibrio aestuarii]|uniref:hypothetical protein n=1 Tax=Halodesulfovibrio aestuarii TaxID=126333 RepID=UPI0003FF2508
MKKEKMKYLKCCNGQFLLHGVFIGNQVSVKIQKIRYLLLKWENGRIVDSKRYTGRGVWPEGYSLCAELFMLIDGERAYLTVYEQVIKKSLNPYLENMEWGPNQLKDVVTHMTCSMEGGINQISFTC